MPKQLVRLALVLLLVSISCSLPAFTDPPATPAATPQAVAQLFVSPAPNSTATPTPFQPLGPTITPTITPTPTETPALEPTGEEAANQPTPVRVSQNLPEGTVNFLVLGSDQRPGGGYRTDVVMLVSINTGKSTVNIVSFPRDLYIPIPGWTTQRVNTVFAHGGFPMMADTFEYNFGVRPSFYVMTNFDGFKGIINSMGGIDVNVGQYLSDSCDLPQSVAGRCTVYPGVVSMDGATALWYVRSRHSSSDFDRLRRAQEVLYAIFDQLMSMDALSRAPELFSDFQSSVETNISVDDILPLLPVAANVLGDPSLIHRYSIGPGQVYDYITEGGAMVLLPNYNAIALIIAQAIYSQ